MHVLGESYRAVLRASHHRHKGVQVRRGASPVSNKYTRDERGICVDHTIG